MEDKCPAKRIRFMLDGCDIWLVAEAPEDITLKQLLKQCDRIRPDYCACGIRSLTEAEEYGYEDVSRMTTDVVIDYDNVQKADKNAACTIVD